MPPSPPILKGRELVLVFETVLLNYSLKRVQLKGLLPF